LEFSADRKAAHIFWEVLKEQIMKKRKEIQVLKVLLLILSNLILLILDEHALRENTRLS
jgi:hypothetical protein